MTPPTSSNSNVGCTTFIQRFVVAAIASVRRCLVRRPHGWALSLFPVRDLEAGDIAIVVTPQEPRGDGHESIEADCIEIVVIPTISTVETRTFRQSEADASSLEEVVDGEVQPRTEHDVSAEPGASVPAAGTYQSAGLNTTERSDAQPVAETHEETQATRNSESNSIEVDGEEEEEIESTCVEIANSEYDGDSDHETLTNASSSASVSDSDCEDCDDDAETLAFVHSELVEIRQRILQLQRELATN